jgi:capsular polysaccharide biosynthesis protein
MSQTIHLIGLHGAGLTNMLFMREGGKVLELRNQNDAHNNCYFSLASELNLDYFYLLNQGNTNDTHTVDIIVDIDELRNNLGKFI